MLPKYLTPTVVVIQSKEKMECCNFRVAVKNLDIPVNIDRAREVLACKQTTLYAFTTSKEALEALDTLRVMGHQANLVDPYAVFIEYVELKDPYELCTYFSTFGKICMLLLYRTHAFVVFYNKKAAVDTLKFGSTHWIRDDIFIKVRPKKMAECDPFAPKPYSPIRPKPLRQATTYVV